MSQSDKNSGNKTRTLVEIRINSNTKNGLIERRDRGTVILPTDEPNSFKAEVVKTSEITVKTIQNKTVVTPVKVVKDDK